MPQLPGVLLVVLGRAHRAVQQGLQRVRQGADRSAGRRQNHIAGEGVVEGRTQAESRPARESCRRLATRWTARLVWPLAPSDERAQANFAAPEEADSLEPRRPVRCRRGGPARAQMRPSLFANCLTAKWPLDRHCGGRSADGVRCRRGASRGIPSGDDPRPPPARSSHQGLPFRRGGVEYSHLRGKAHSPQALRRIRFHRVFRQRPPPAVAARLERTTSPRPRTIWSRP